MKAKTLTLLLLLLCVAAFSPLAFGQTTVSIIATDYSAAETWPGQTPNPGNVRITRTGNTAGAFTVWLKLSGTAVRGADYSLGGVVGTYAIIPAGSAQLDIPINVLDDLTTEVAETVRVELDDNTSSGVAVPYTISNDNRAIVNIADNDDPNTPPRAVVSVMAVQNAAEGTNGVIVPGTFRFTRTANLNIAVTVTYSVGGSAISGSDYDALSGSVTIPAGVASADVSVLPVDDSVLESLESVTLSILPSSCPGIFPPPPDCYTIGAPASASVTILDNEIPPPPPTVTFNVGQDATVFGLPARVNGSFTASSSNGFIASYIVRVDGAVRFSGNTGYPVTPAPGTPFDFSFSITNLTTTGTHQFQVTATDDQGLSTTTNRALFITAIQPPPPPPATYSIVTLDSEASETVTNELPNIGRFLFTRTGTPGNLEFAFFTFTGSAREGVDYAVIYSPWNSTMNGVTNIVTQEITIYPKDDLLIEGDETVKLELCFPIITMIESGGAGAPTGSYCTGNTPGQNATITIHDNDTTPPPFPVVSVIASDADAQEVSPLSGQPQNPGAFTITRTAPATNDVTVNYSLSRPVATAIPTLNHIALNGVDYETLSGMVVIPTGSVSATIALNPIFDTWVEGSETVTLTLLPATNSPTPYLLDAGATNSATVTIRDFAPTNIPVVSIKATDAQAYEANVVSRTASFLVSRTGSVTNALTLPYAISGEASNGVDYVTLPGTVTIPASNASVAIIIDPIADAVVEPVETVALTLQAAPADVFPPAYLFSALPSLQTSAGVSIRDQVLPVSPPYGLSPRQRIVWLRRHRHVIVPLPAAPVVAAAPAVGTNVVTTTWAVEASTDFVTWQEIGTTADPEEFVDVDAGDAMQRFYRFRQLTP